MATIRIARHGETTWNAAGRYQGRIDAPLSTLGQAQAQALAAALTTKGIVRIISSPLSRCVHTATPLSAATGVPIETDPLLTEIAHGTWQGRYREEIAQNDPVVYWEWREHPERVQFAGGESLHDVMRRWQKFVAKLDAAKNSLIVTHDIVVRVAILERLGRRLEELRAIKAVNCAYAEFESGSPSWTLTSLCESAHLTGLVAEHERQAL